MTSAGVGRSLSILFFYDCIFPATVGGVEHRNYEAARALVARGHRVTLAGFADEVPPPEGGLSVVSLGPRKPLYTARGKRSTLEAIRLAGSALSLDLRSFDVVEASNIPFLHLPVLAIRCRLIGIPFVVTWHEYWGRYWREYLGAPWPAYAAVERLTVTLGVRVAADSRLTGSRVESRRRESPVVIPVGIPMALIQRAAFEGAVCGGPPLIYAGRLLREKRVDLLLQAVARLGQTHTGPLLTVVGDGPDRERLRLLARDLGLLGASPVVSFQGRVETSADVWRLLGTARIAVQPSSREGFGLFPLEAMAAGLPVVHCESGESALNEIVEPGVTGVCTPPHPDTLAAALASLLDDPAELSRLSAGARARASRYDWSVVAVELERLFLSVVAGA